MTVKLKPNPKWTRLTSQFDSQVNTDSQVKANSQIDLTLKSTNSPFNGESQINGNLEVDVEFQIKSNQIKAQIEAQKKVNANVWPMVKRGISL